MLYPVKCFTSYVNSYITKRKKINKQSNREKYQTLCSLHKKEPIVNLFVNLLKLIYSKYFCKIKVNSLRKD